MALKAFRKTIFKELPTAQLQNSVALFANQLTNNPILAGHLIENIEVINGVTSINHGLGANLRGYIVTKQSSAVSTWLVETNQTTPNTILNLSADASSTISIYVF